MSCLCVQIGLSRPDSLAVMRGFVPSANLYTVPGELFIAAGIVGATIMPHNLFLHTSLVLTRNVDRNDIKAVRAAIRYSTVDTVVALLFALFVNAAILIVAASTFNVNGYTNIATLEGGCPCVLSFPCHPQWLRVDRASPRVGPYSCRRVPPP